MNFNEFKIDEFKILSSILIVGNNVLNKENVICLLINHFKKNIPVGIIINNDLCEYKSLNKIKNHSVKHTVLYIHEKYEDEIVNKLLFRQQAIINKNIIKEYKMNTNSLLILNNCIKLLNDNINIKEIIYNSRCYNIEFILAIDNILSENQNIIKQFDYIVMLPRESITNIEKIYEYVKDEIDTFDIFLKIYEELSKDNNVIVIDNNKKCKKIYWMTLDDIG
jgi:hypothetical protein